MHVFINSVMYNDFECDNYVFMVDSAIYYPGGMDMLELCQGNTIRPIQFLSRGVDLLECVSLYLDFDCHACDCVRGGVVYPIFDHCPGGGVRTCCDCVRGGTTSNLLCRGVDSS